MKGLECLRLHLQGKTQAEIAAELGISQPTVSRYIDRALRESPVVTEVAKLREREVQKCNMREQEAYAAWERSLKRDKHGKPTGEGERGFLSEAGDAARDRARLLGLNLPAAKGTTEEREARVAALTGINPDQMPE
jgi:DNA-binding Lrp family transcriptional regulator